ncbi:MAG: di-trans,poly-cis-decaprenylcistransferase [Elusimicrobia bacterium CG08_land_8_20_14_0_20_51_18]|nr:MAG: di-trans,poly-cis-decaprenylcistransferase [Elusimicrobia bacterium CG08_land_8_20_14_0_20_51_18]
MLEIIKKINPEKLPRHVAIIMDGNRRWAKRRGFPATYGHKKGVDTVKKIVEATRNLGIKQLTLYAFSTENWNRSKLEIKTLMFLLKKVIKDYRGELYENGIELKISGRLSELPENVVKEINSAVDYLRNGKKMVLNIALNYGGRQEILDAVNALISEKAGKITEEDVSRRLYTYPLPDPDLVIRTSGEMRLSNFLLWQSAYSELYVSEVLWPDFSEKNFFEAILEYSKRERRAGA